MRNGGQKAAEGGKHRGPDKELYIPAFGEAHLPESPASFQHPFINWLSYELGLRAIIKNPFPNTQSYPTIYQEVNKCNFHIF